ncbi:MAG: hypothetical protein BIFFINMI_03032 [Phycisphaerae bacterium]|nr:hypothetical protein [Phycisphaerae bacterium]
MMRKLWEIVAIIAAAHLLAAGVLAGALFATGKLSGNKLKLIRDVMLDRPLQAAAAKTETPAVQPDNLTTAGQRIADEREQTQVTQLQIEQQMRELKDFKVQLDQAKGALDLRISQFEADRKKWQEQREAERVLLAGAGFKKSLEMYESLDADQAKDLFMNMDDAEVVRYLTHMDPRKAAKAAKAFQTPAEQAKLRKVLDYMEDPSAAKTPAADATGKTDNRQASLAGRP